MVPSQDDVTSEYASPPDLLRCGPQTHRIFPFSVQLSPLVSASVLSLRVSLSVCPGSLFLAPFSPPSLPLSFSLPFPCLLFPSTTLYLVSHFACLMQTYTRFGFLVLPEEIL